MEPFGKMLEEWGVLDAEEAAALEKCASFMLGDIDASEYWSAILGTCVEVNTIDLELGFGNDCLLAATESLDDKHLLFKKLADALFPWDKDVFTNDG